MPDILIRGIDSQTLTRLKARAKRNGRSLQNEAKHILENAKHIQENTASSSTLQESLAIAAQWRQKFAEQGKRFTDSADLIREDRQQ